MTLAIMQPYVFPYIGYFQLIHAADKFVVYDDVSFIKQGWINRNRILLNGSAHMFTVPLKNASSFTNICDTELDKKAYTLWASKFLKTLAQAYAKAPCYGRASEVVAAVLSGEHDTISTLASSGLQAVCNYLDIDTPLVLHSAGYGSNELKGKDRVLDICRQELAAVYVNPSGGRELYAKDEFAANGIQLHFIDTAPIRYPQYTNEFVPWLSIIDVMMFNDVDTIKGFLNNYTLG